MDLIPLDKKTALPFYPLIFSIFHSYIGKDNFIVFGAADKKNHQPLGAITATVAESMLIINSLYVDEQFRRRGVGTQLVNRLKTVAAKQYETIKLYYILPDAEIEIFDAFIQTCGFAAPDYEGEIFCFNPYRIVQTKFTRKTLDRGQPFLPEGWELLRYNKLDDAMIRRLNDAKAIFPADIDWDMHWDTLDLPHSLVICNATDIIGYISQQRLTTNSVAVPCFATNPAYRGAGLYLLKYYMYVIHFETPEIFQVRCHFTPRTIGGKKLFEYYTEKNYNRHSIAKSTSFELL